MFNVRFASACLVLTLSYSLSAEAKLYKWVDNKGITHYGEVIPPEYADKQKDTLKKSGMIEKRPEGVDTNAVHAKQDAENKKKLDSQAAMEQLRRDNALLNTYSNENEIDQARDRNLVLINARIESNKMLLKSSQTTLEGHRLEHDNRTKAKRPIPASLTSDIERSETRILGFQTQLNKSESELAVVRERFDKEKQLYRKLKSGSGSK